MKLFTPLYNKCITLSKHPRAPWVLGGLSFAESSFFPIPPDVMLAPMSLAKPEKAWYYALITTLFSVIGGCLGYLIGITALEMVLPWIESAGHMHHYEQAKGLFDEYGFVAIFIAGFSPIPYKLFTISAGAAHMAILPFIFASCIGRGARFFLVAGLMKLGGKKMQDSLQKYVEILGWIVIALAIIAYIIWVK